LTAFDRCGVLLAAHGERGGGADNGGVMALADELRRRDISAEIGCGFIKGSPTISEAVFAFTTPQIVVYPLFLSDGYFTRIRLPQLLAEAASHGRDITMLPPLGLDSSLPKLIGARASAAVRASGYQDRHVSVICLAHGSSKDTASHDAAERLAQALRASKRFAAVYCAFLEEPPGFEDVIAGLPGPVVVVGLFAGEGMHGAEDLPRLMAAVPDRACVFAGNVGTWPEIADVIAAAVRDAGRVGGIQSRGPGN
jgi:sirohydrochlorin cobaltochelatase